MIKQSKWQPIDRLSIALIIIFSLIIFALIWAGIACNGSCPFLNPTPEVKNFSWQGKVISAEDRAFLLTFDRPMQRDSVAKNLRIEPVLEGKMSWVGKKMAYTLNYPAPYGQEYQLSLANAQEHFPYQKQAGRQIKPFTGNFRSRDRAFVYIGTTGTEKDRLVYYNWTREKKLILTPDNLVVMDFKPYYQGDRILFSAASNDIPAPEAIRQLQLYRVTIPEDFTSQQTPSLELVLDNKEYQNNKFDLSRDGKTIVLQRINRQNPGDFGLWLIRENNKAIALNNSPGGDFIIAPDSQTLAIAQTEGIALLPLQPEAQPLDFLPKFGQVLSFSADGSAAAMINYNTESKELRYTQSLFYVDNRGVQKELLNTTGSIRSCQFNPTATDLYCLLTRLIEEEEEYQEEPYLAVINLKAGSFKPLVTLPQYQDIHMSIAPDGFGILLDLPDMSDDSSQTSLPRRQGNGQIWLLSNLEGQLSKLSSLEKLPMQGWQPEWLP